MTERDSQKVVLDGRNSTKRFQIERQNTTVLSNEEKKEEEEPEEQVFEDVESYEEKIEKIVLELNVQATSLKTKDSGHTLVTFCLENSSIENTLIRLQEHGIGSSPSDTSISVIPASVHFQVPIGNDSNVR